MKYIDSEKLIELVKEWRSKQMGFAFDAVNEVLKIITSLQQEQPDNEDIDKVAQELYEHLYELKRRNNVPTNLYDKQEIIDLWKAGVEYGRNHPKQEQPEVDLEKVVEFECIGKKVKMTIQELINYYIDSECYDVADECGF